MSNFNAEWFLAKISAMPDDLVSTSEYLDWGRRNIFNDTVELPEPGSEFAQFIDLIWKGTYEHVADILQGKAKKHKFTQATPKLRILAALEFIKKHDPEYTCHDPSIANMYWRSINQNESCVFTEFCRNTSKEQWGDFLEWIENAKNKESVL